MSFLSSILSSSSSSSSSIDSNSFEIKNLFFLNNINNYPIVNKITNFENFLKTSIFYDTIWIIFFVLLLFLTPSLLLKRSIFTPKIIKNSKKGSEIFSYQHPITPINLHLTPIN